MNVIHNNNNNRDLHYW